MACVEWGGTITRTGYGLEREAIIRKAVAKAGIGWREYVRQHGAKVGPALDILGGE
jgi:hypothetical protein